MAPFCGTTSHFTVTMEQKPDPSAEISRKSNDMNLEFSYDDNLGFNI